MGNRTKWWSYSAGERGRNRVRVFEHHVSGTLFLDFYEAAPGGARPRRKRMALGHTDRELAKAKAEELASRLRLARALPEPEPTLRALFDMYMREVTPAKGRGSKRTMHGARRCCCARSAQAARHVR
jgi:hypothetical protein